MKVSLGGAELEENLGLRYMASSLESSGHLWPVSLMGRCPQAEVADGLDGAGPFR